jgi:hypothetical protein
LGVAARRADIPAEWRCGCDAKEKMKISLRREKVKWADRAGSALPGRKVGRGGSPRRHIRRMAVQLRCEREDED